MHFLYDLYAIYYCLWGHLGLPVQYTSSTSRSGSAQKSTTVCKKNMTSQIRSHLQNRFIMDTVKTCSHKREISCMKQCSNI